MTAGSPWKNILARRLPELGHRNWIGVVDSAYPLQTSPGIVITHRFALDRVADAYSLMASGKCGKVAVVFE